MIVLIHDLVEHPARTAEQEFPHELVLADDKLGPAGPAQIGAVGFANLLHATDANHDDAFVPGFFVDGLERNLVHGLSLDGDRISFLPAHFIQESTRAPGDHSAEKLSVTDDQRHLTSSAGENEARLVCMPNFILATQHGALAASMFRNHSHEFPSQSLSIAAHKCSENSESFHVDPRTGRLSRAGFFLRRSSLLRMDSRSPSAILTPAGAA